MFFPSVNAVVQKSVDRSDLNSIGVKSMNIFSNRLDDT